MLRRIEDIPAGTLGFTALGEVDAAEDWLATESGGGNGHSQGQEIDR